MVSVGGLASGLDTNGIISQLIELERRPITKLQQDIAELQQIQASFTGLSTRFSGLRSAAESLSLSNLNQPSVTVGDTDKVTVTAASSATVGSHQLAISQLATANRIVSQGFADEDTTPISSSSGDFVVQVGSSGAQISVAITSTTTMADLVSAINAASGDVSATVIDDGTNALSKRLVLSSTKTGFTNDVQVVTNVTDLDFASANIEAASADSSNAGTYTGSATSSGSYTGSANKTFLIEIVDPGAVGAATYRVSEDGGLTWDDNASAGFSTSAVAGAIGSNGEGVEIAFSAGGTLTTGDRFYVDVSTPTLTEGLDAVFTLDGLTQTRDDNQVTDALSGVTLNLVDTTTSDVTFSISQDDEAVVTAVQDFATAYNDLHDEIRSQQTFDTDTLEAGLLLGDRTANSILSQLRLGLSRTVAGSGSYDSLASLGIQSSSTGSLSVDAAELREALSADRDGVLSVLASTESTSSSQIIAVSRPTEEADGTYTVQVTTAPEVATVSSGGAQADTLGAAETLSFVYSANYTESSPTTSSFSVALQSGDTLNDVIDRLNSAFATQGARLQAYSSSGTLTIDATEFGGDYYFSVVSDTASGANTTRIGTTPLSDEGVDIVGTVGGATTTGAGNRLQVASGQEIEGLAVTYSGTSVGSVGTVTISTGAGEAFRELVDTLNSDSTSIVATRTASIQDQIDEIGERIVDKEEQVARVQTRLEEQFAALEVQLAGLQSQADFLTNQLALLTTQSRQSSSGNR